MQGRGRRRRAAERVMEAHDPYQEGVPAPPANRINGQYLPDRGPAPAPAPHHVQHAQHMFPPPPPPALPLAIEVVEPAKQHTGPSRLSRRVDYWEKQFKETNVELEKVTSKMERMEAICEKLLKHQNIMSYCVGPELIKRGMANMEAHEEDARNFLDHDFHANWKALKNSYDDKYRVLQMEMEARKRRQRIEDAKEQGNCSVCLTEKANTAMIPCYHLASCEECSKNLARCPICRGEIKERQRIYLA